jgi:poly(hydroxyalkanoate) depolymerase family esterase
MRKVLWLGSLVTIIAATLATSVGNSPANAALGPGTFSKYTHPGVGDTGPRDYYVYEPTTAATTPRPLVVFLHGCTQTARDAAIGTRWTEYAERENFVVVLPEQPAAANGTQCWNWFEPQHQSRGAGEPAVIDGIAAQVIALPSANVDASRVYVFGISAGADMATILGATYPDRFAAVGAAAGCAYLTCADVTGAAAHQAMGPRSRVVPAFLVQGTADMLNNFALGETMERQWVGTNDLADDGAFNGSVPAAPSSIDHTGLDVSLLSGIGTVGDACVRNKQFPCAGAVIGAKSYPYSVAHHAGGNGCSVVDFWVVHGLNHGYPGGDPQGSFTDPLGPNITAAAYTFFLHHRLDAGPCSGTS